MNKRIIVSVSSDIATDQRVQKQCRALHKSGYSLTLVGRDLGRDIPIDLPFKYLHLSLPFRKGPLMYAWFNIRLFFYLLFQKADFYVSNDLDTLLATGLVARLKSKPYWYDSHEYFTQVPEVVNRPFVQKSWRAIERAFIGRAAIVSTVSPAIVQNLEADYQLKDVALVRNFPEPVDGIQPKSRVELGVEESMRLLIIQGNGINIDRGGEELVEAISLVANAHLLVVGSGDALPVLKQMAKDLSIENRVSFIPPVPYREMLAYTAASDVGLSLDKGTNMNYQFSLPNKIFDYALVGTPVIASRLQETARWVEGYDIGVLVDEVTPADIAKAIEVFFSNAEKASAYATNASRMIEDHNWNTEMAPVLAQVKAILQ